jgi:cytochrome d ubiquinol oxidase subunit I
MRTSEAVTPVGHLAAPFAAFSIVYVFLAVMVAVLLRRQIAHAPTEPAAGVAA